MTRTKTPESSNIVSVGFEEHSHTLEIEFQRGAVYRYANVPHAVWVHFMSAPSKGAFFAKQIKQQYPATKVSQ